MSDIDTFRTQTRAWLAENCPQSMRSPYVTDEDLVWGGRNAKFVSEDQKLWLDRMASRGWTAPTWPAEYGGGGLDREHAKVLAEEMARIHARPALESFGISMLGPALLKFGSEELKQQHLPPIVRGEIRWAQGYSEPNAGSDLASLQTRATDEGDHYVLNGSKIWTSYGDKGDWMFCLVRTDVDAPKHEGISFVLLDMTTPGVTTKPIRLISGRSPFTETFFENARVEKNQAVGEVNKGWTVAKYLLTHEREMIGESGVASAGTETLSEIAISQLGKSNGKLRDSVLRSSVAKFEIDEACLALTINRAQDETKAGVSLGAVSSMFKYYGTELNMRRYELLMDLHGTEALAWESEDDGLLPKSWLRTKGNSIEGGTSEIQLNIIAKRILNLPS